MKSSRALLLGFATVMLVSAAAALDRPEVTFKVFQFPADKIPRVDGDAGDWAMVPDDYAIGMDQFVDDSSRHAKPDTTKLDVKIRVGWVKGLNRLYFLYEAYADSWNFSSPDLNNNIFEVVVDGDASGGPLVDRGRSWTAEEVGAARAAPEARISAAESHWAIQGAHAQNYHVFTPAKDKDWCMAWSAATWVKELPWANSACSYNFKSGESGKLVLEFWITPFDYAGPEGPQRAIESVLSENKIIGLSFAIFDRGDPKRPGGNPFWNLSRHHSMVGNASELCAFKLMPVEPQYQKPIEARWSWTMVDMDRRLVAFKDLSVGKVTSWKWNFGDGESSTDQNPIHAYKEARSDYVVILDVEGPAGTSRRSKVWDIQFK